MHLPDREMIVNFVPTGLIPTKEMTPHVPISVSEIREDIHEACELGITMVHLHVRDDKVWVLTECLLQPLGTIPSHQYIKAIGDQDQVDDKIADVLAVVYHQDTFVCHRLLQ